MTNQRTLHRVPMLADGAGRCARPGAVLVHDGRVIDAGEPQKIGAPADARIIEHHDIVALPGLVNAHCHLDLSHIGPAPYGGDFAAWIETVIERRAGDDAAIAEAVARGVALSRAGGVSLVGDIAGVGSDVPWRVLRELGMAAVSFVEVFGLGARQPAAIARMGQVVADAAKHVAADGASVVRLGVQPHAPYTCGLDVYLAAATLGLPVATHLAESPEEIAFTTAGDGALAALLRRRGVELDAPKTPGHHPVDHVAEAIAQGRHVLVHLNYVEPAHLDQLAAWDVHVAYCPRASAYFGHPRGGASPHAYRAMLERGINVALGTDGLLCVDTPDRLSTLDEMRLLYRRDATDAITLLRMATVNGAVALGADPGDFTFGPGAGAGIIAVGFDAGAADPLDSALRGSSAPRWLLAPAIGGRAPAGAYTGAYS